MYYDLMKVWVEEIWFKHTQAKYKKLSFQNSMLSFNAFAASLTEWVKKQLLEINVNASI